MSSHQAWQLLHEDIHIWRVPLDQPAHAVDWLAAFLDADEHQRAARFQFANLRRQFTVARGVMRHVLAGYLRVHPAELTFTYGPKGKPALGGVGAGDGLTFNLSHASELALLAVGRGRVIGVDIEAVRPLAELDAIALRYFCPTERAILAASDEHGRRSWFYRFWTRKEALLKATGDGLSLPLDRLDVSGANLGTAQPMTVLDGTGTPRQLTVQDLDPGDGYTGAVAVEGAGWRSRTWTWHPHLGEARSPE